MINNSVKKFIYDRLMVTSVAGVFTKDIALGMRNCRMDPNDNTRAVVISDYKGVSYLLGVKLLASSFGMEITELGHSPDYHDLLVRYMTMETTPL